MEIKHENVNRLFSGIKLMWSNYFGNFFHNFFIYIYIYIYIYIVSRIRGEMWLLKQKQ